MLTSLLDYFTIQTTSGWICF